MGKNFKTQNVTALKISKCCKINRLKFWQRSKKLKTKILTTVKITLVLKKLFQQEVLQLELLATDEKYLGSVLQTCNVLEQIWNFKQLKKIIPSEKPKLKH